MSDFSILCRCPDSRLMRLIRSTLAWVNSCCQKTASTADSKHSHLCLPANVAKLGVAPHRHVTDSRTVVSSVGIVAFLLSSNVESLLKYQAFTVAVKLRRQSLIFAKVFATQANVATY